MRKNYEFSVLKIGYSILDAPTMSIEYIDATRD